MVWRCECEPLGFCWPVAVERLSLYTTYGVLDARLSCSLEWLAAGSNLETGTSKGYFSLDRLLGTERCCEFQGFVSDASKPYRLTRPVHTQRAQYPLIKEYGLNYIGHHITIYDIFLN